MDDSEDSFPDLHQLFLYFNELYFEGLLSHVEVKWSNRMTLCAGLCYYHFKQGFCSIRLSEKLLQFRPKQDFVNTLLHEMIHAYLFVTNNNRDHDGHGPEFVKKMVEINDKSGSSISIYHNFTDEVDYYRKHVWRCDGKCKDAPPFYGFVKRAMNRPPQKADWWFADHQRNCGGTFEKVAEPEVSEKGKRKAEDVSQSKLDSFVKKPNQSTSAHADAEEVVEMLKCPICQFLVNSNQINEHIDLCLIGC